MKKLLIFLAVLIGIFQNVCFAEDSIPLIFRKHGGGQFIYCNNPEFVVADNLSTDENPNAEYMMNNENLKPGKYSVFFCFYNWTDFNIEPDIEFKSDSDATITIDSVGFYIPQGSEEWDCLGVWADYLSINIASMNNLNQFVPYQGKTLLPATFNLSDSSEWISRYIYNYESLMPQVTFNMLVNFTIESGEVDVNFAALKHYGVLGDRSRHNPNAAKGKYVNDTSVKGIDTETLPIVEADIEIEITPDTPNGENLNMKLFNQANPDGVVVPYWTSNINPNRDGSVFCRNTAVSSDMLEFVYRDDTKLGFYGENIPENERDNIWRIDIYHQNTKGYSDAMPWKEDLHIPNAPTSEHRPISENILTDFEFNLGNFGVTNRHNFTITNSDTTERTLNYYIDSARTSNIVIVYDEDGNILNPYTLKKENAFAISKAVTWDARTEVCMFSAEVPPGETRKYTVDVILPTNNYGGQLNILRADTKKNLTPVSYTPFPKYTKEDDFKDVFFNGSEYMKWENGRLYTFADGTWERTLLPQKTEELFKELSYKVKLIKTDNYGYAAKYSGWDRDAGWITKKSKNKLYFLDSDFNITYTTDYPDYIHDFTFADNSLYIKSDTIYRLTKNSSERMDIHELPKNNGKYTLTRKDDGIYIDNKRISFEYGTPWELYASGGLFYYRKARQEYTTNVGWDNIVSVSKDGVSWFDIPLSSSYQEDLKVYCFKNTVYIDTKYERFKYELPEKNIVRVLLNNEYLAFDTCPEIVNDRTMVPIRYFFEKLGAEVEWDEINRKITSQKDGHSVVLWIDRLHAIVDNKTAILDSAPYIENSRTMIPLRFLSENLGFNVYWNKDTMTAEISGKY